MLRQYENSIDDKRQFTALVKYICFPVCEAVDG